MELIQRCRAGDEDAFAALFHQHKNLVYKTAYLLLGDAHAAEAFYPVSLLLQEY